jgi:uncharacterized low-complexity protein
MANLTKTVSIAFVFLASALFINTASADVNPFAKKAETVQTITGDDGKCGDKKEKKDGKCGEGKCGDKKGKKDGKCGEGKCGDKKGKKDGKCGEGKCGDKKGKKKEGKCGDKKSKDEGKCGSK